jgi:hypothetical protein
MYLTTGVTKLWHLEPIRGKLSGSYGIDTALNFKCIELFSNKLTTFLT